MSWYILVCSRFIGRCLVWLLVDGIAAAATGSGSGGGAAAAA